MSRSVDAADWALSVLLYGAAVVLVVFAAALVVALLAAVGKAIEQRKGGGS